MQPVLLETSFLDVIWWMLIVFFWSMIFWMFISVFVDMFRRDDLSGWGKAAWSLAFIFLPLLGILIYMIVRPRDLPSDSYSMGATWHDGGRSPAEEIDKAKQLHDAGTINQEEFDELKRRALR